MTIAEILLQDYDVEISNTRCTLERVPEDNPDWTPHAKSMKLGKLAMHCASLPIFGYYIMEDEGMDMANSKRPQSDFTFTTREACLQRLDESSTKCRAAIANASDEHLAALWKFSFGEHLISHNPRSMAFRTMCFDHLVHHTAQLASISGSTTSLFPRSMALQPTNSGPRRNKCLSRLRKKRAG